LSSCRRRHWQRSHARRPARVEAAAQRFGLPLEFHHFDWAHCDYYAAHGKMMPDDWKAHLQGMDAIFYGAAGPPPCRPCVAVGFAAEVPPRVRPVHQPASGAPVRRRPARWPAANPATSTITWCARTPRASIPSLGGIMYEGTDREIVIQESVYLRHGEPPACSPSSWRKASEEACDAGHQSNGIAISMPWCNQRRRHGQALPEVTLDSSTSTSSRALCCSPGALTWWPPPTCLATSSPTGAGDHRAPLAWRHPPT
jgi:tartrate dehydrogenase/decarboxylase/D-malate dehydrogenase